MDQCLMSWRGRGLAILARWYPVPLLAFHVVAGVALLGYYLAIADTTPYDNFRIYYAAAESALGGGIQYRPSYYSYVYQPPTVVVFVPFTFLPFEIATVLWRVLNVAVLVVLGTLVWQWVEYLDVTPEDRAARPLVFATLLAGTWSLLLLLNAQMDIALATLVWAGLYWLETGSERRAGVAVAIAASVKVFPAVLGVWFLVRRQFEAVAAAIATGAGVVAVGLFVFGPDQYRRYFRVVVEFRDYAALLDGVPDPNSELLSIARPVAAASGGLPYVWLLVAGLVVTACTLAVVFVNVDPTDRRERFATALVTVLVAVVALPTGQNSYTFYAVPGLVVALFVVSGRWPRALVGGGFALLAVPLDPEELLRLRDVAAPGAVPAVFAALETMLTVASVELYGFALAVAGLALFVGVPRWRG